MWNAAAPMERSREAPHKIKNRTTIQCSIPTSYTLKGNEIRISKIYLHSRVHSASFTVTKMWSGLEYEWTKGCAVCVQWDIIQLQTGRSL
jgi:Pyruvate/2-oxoacid:ferredoxin oxidoreductase delta subunit